MREKPNYTQPPRCSRQKNDSNLSEYPKRDTRTRPQFQPEFRSRNGPPTRRGKKVYYSASFFKPRTRHSQQAPRPPALNLSNPERSRMQKEILLEILKQNQFTSSFSLERVNEENASFRLNDKTASVGFIYRHIGETMNLFGQ